MVRGVTDEERRSFARKVKAAFVALVGLSAGLIALQGDVDATGFLVATAGGLVAGVVLLRVAFPSSEDLD